LRIIVDKYQEIKEFEPEDFWTLRPKFIPDPNNPQLTTMKMNWKRTRIFDKETVESLCQIAMEDRLNSKVVQIVERSKSRWRPVPLSTVTLMASAARHLRLSSAETMSIAERLYQKGLISYPRTETEIYPDTLPVLDLIRNISQNSVLGSIAHSILNSRG